MTVNHLLSLFMASQNVLVSVHTGNNCVECLTYMCHVKKEIISRASLLIPPSDEDLEAAITKAFPLFMVRYSKMTD